MAAKRKASDIQLGYPIELIRCKAIGHVWDDIGAQRKSRWGVAVTFRCVQCFSERIDIMNMRGELGARYYEHATAYQELPHHDRAWWRSQLLRQMQIGASSVDTRR